MKKTLIIAALLLSSLNAYAIAGEANTKSCEKKDHASCSKADKAACEKMDKKECEAKHKDCKEKCEKHKH